MNLFPASELILNKDGSVYHLNLLPNDVADTIITVGDPDRVEMIAKHLDKIRVKKKNREFYTITGTYKTKEITILSTGIGTDNIDIVLNELNILSKIDLSTLSYLHKPKTFTIVRLGTSGTLSEKISLGSMIISTHAVGLEGLLNFYPMDYTPLEISLNTEIKKVLSTDFPFLNPYVTSSSTQINELFSQSMLQGFTATCQGFYHPQGRFLWSKNNKSILMALKNFEHGTYAITNFEMETAGILGLAKYFNHEASSISLILANRISNEFIQNAEQKMEEMIEFCLEKLSTI